MNAMVTGAAGFVGSHLVERLLARGDSVVGVDNCCTGSVENLAHLRDDERFTFVGCDASCELPDVAELDAIFHFASPASPRDYGRLPLQTLRANAAGTELSCELARRKSAKLIFASTSEVYGDPLVHPQSEDYSGNVNPIGPRACYDEGKRYGEAVVSVYDADPEFDGRIVRLFNTYGPRMRAGDGRVVPNFIEQALQGLELTVYGDGRQTRSLCYVDDTVSMILAFADLPEPEYRVVNIGSDEEVSILHVATLIAEIAGTPLRLSYLPAMPDDPHRRRPDLTRAMRMLGSLPKTPLRYGLARTLSAWRGPQTTIGKESRGHVRAL
jgi:dTDP-glucose 4,6-dehydratase